MPSRNPRYLTELYSDSDVCEQTLQGPTLSPDEAARLSAQITQEPNNLDLRLLLLAYLEPLQFSGKQATKANKERGKHILWLVRRVPTHPALRWPHAQLLWNHEKYAEYKQLWLKHLDETPDDLNLLKNAAESLLVGDSRISERLLKRGKTLAPLDPDWDHWLATIYLIRSDRTSGHRSAMWRKLASRHRSSCTRLRKRRNSAQDQ